MSKCITLVTFELRPLADSFEGPRGTLKAMKTPSMNEELKGANWNIASAPESVYQYLALSKFILM